MILPSRPGRRGQPLFALGFLMLAWIGARTAVMATDGTPDSIPVKSNVKIHRSSIIGTLATVKALGGMTEPHSQTSPPQVEAAGVPLAPDVIAPAPIATPGTDLRPAIAPKAEGPVPPRITEGHRLLMMAGLSKLPMHPEALAATPPPLPLRAPVPFLPGARKEAIRWSADGWVLWRPGGNGYNLPGAGLPGANIPSGTYGASQAGLVVRYRLSPSSPLRPTLYLRASTGLRYPRGEELAAGFALRPLPKLPLAAMAEARVTHTPTGNLVRPAFALVTELPPAGLPLDLRGEVYGQAGWVGGKDHTPFVDGQARIERPLVHAGRMELRLGVGAWGGAQRGTSRLDAGPTVTVDMPIGPLGGRLSADYRFRLAGNAAPGSGPAVTLSAGF